MASSQIDSGDPVQVERIGFSLLHQPPASNSAGGPPDHTANIVFIHGLRGHPRNTWEYARGPNVKPTQGVGRHNFFDKAAKALRNRKESAQPVQAVPSAQAIYWPAQILPQEIPRARIWTYGYNADVIAGLFRQNNKNSILQHANDLMVKLERTLNDEQPIIFVAHSLGGVILKRALSDMESSKDDNLGSILRRVFAVVFCGTPHRGASLAMWGTTLSKLVTVAFVDSTTRLLTDLSIDSQILDMIQDEFLRTLDFHPSLRVHSFLEGKAMTGIKGLDDKVVDDFSGKLGWSRGSRFETIDANHRDMVKEPGVKDISSVLKLFENDLKRAKPKIRMTDTRPPYPYVEEFFTFDYIASIDLLADPYQDTCSWISEAEAFKSWIAGEQSRIYWIHGFPGLGKSVIAKYMLQFLGESFTEKDSSSFVLYFFCSYRDTSSRSIRSLLSSLIHQILRKMPTLAYTSGTGATRLKFFDGTYHRPKLDDLGFLSDTFRQLIEEHSKRYPSSSANVLIVIDALDELNRSEWDAFLKISGDIDSSTLLWPKNVRLLVTSRTEPAIERELAQKGNLDLGLATSNATDVAKYVRGVVSDYGRVNNFGHEREENIILELITKAEGMFLWASLAWELFIEDIGMWTKSLVTERLQGLRQLPPGMKSLYYRILSSVDRKHVRELSTALQWIVAASRPLTLNEIATALALRARPRKQRMLEIRFNIRAFLKQHCPHLIKVDNNGAITLLHLSFKSYLVETKAVYDGTYWMDNTFHIALDEVDLEIGMDCLSYLALDDFVDKPLDELILRDFFPYAHQYWIHHLTQKDKFIELINPYLLRLLNLETKLFHWYDTSRMLFQIWDCGLWRLFEPLARFGVDINVLNNKGDHIIHHIIDDPLFPTDTLRWLVKLGIDINGKTSLGQSLLHKWISMWHDLLWHLELQDGNGIFASSESTTSFQIDANEEEPTDRNPTRMLEALKKACKELLSFPEIDTNEIDVFGFTPLSYAIYWGITDAVELLLACPYFEARNGGSALHIAAKEGVFGAVKALLERGVDVSSTNRQGETALHLAAANGHFKILKLLVEDVTSAVLNAKDPYGWTAAHRAVTSGNDDLVKWFIGCPHVDLRIKDKHGRLPVSFAAAFGSKEMLMVFLAHEPRHLYYKDWFGNSLLHMASFGGNRQNFSYLLSLPDCPDPGPNKWGRSVADMAPTLGMDDYLHKLGFRHSEKRKGSCLKVLGLQQCQDPSLYAETDSSKWIATREDPKVIEAEHKQDNKVVDTLGRRFGNPTYYALD